MNLAEILFEDIVSSRIEKNVLFFRFTGGWVCLHFFEGEKGERKIRLRAKNGKLLKKEFSQKAFLLSLNNFLLKGDIEEVCIFLLGINLEKNLCSKEEGKISRRGCNIAKEFVMNFLLYRLSYENRERTEIFLWENYYQFFQPGKFYLARRSPKLGKVLGTYTLSLTHYSARPTVVRSAPLRVHLPHLNIHRLVRDALCNLGLRIN